MSTYRRYQDARDAAWRTLLRFSVRALPVDVRGIAAALGFPSIPSPMQTRNVSFTPWRPGPWAERPACRCGWGAPGMPFWPQA